MLMHNTQKLGACPPSIIFKIEITAEAIFGPKQPLEWMFQYSNHRFTARQEPASQAKCKRWTWSWSG